MLWCFTRAAEQIEVEVRRAIDDAAAYELIVTYPDGSERVRRFANATRLVEGTLALQRELLTDDWMPERVLGVRDQHAHHALRPGVRLDGEGTQRVVVSALRAGVRRLLALF